MVVFLYSAQFFPRLFYAQHPHIPSSNLKNKPNPQKIINRGDNSSLSTKEIQGMKEADTSQMVGPSGRQYSEREYREAKQVQKQITNLKVFFYAFSLIIFIKYLVHLIYDLVIYYYNNIINTYLLVIIYLFVISFYATEIALVLLMCKSIKETINAERQYLGQTAQNQTARTRGDGGTPEFSLYKKQRITSQNMNRFRSQNPYATMQSILSSSEQTKVGSPSQHDQLATRQQMIKENTFSLIDVASNSLKARQQMIMPVGFQRQNGLQQTNTTPPTFGHMPPQESEVIRIGSEAEPMNNINNRILGQSKTVFARNRTSTKVNIPTMPSNYNSQYGLGDGSTSPLLTDK